MIVLCMATLVFFNFAVGIIESDDAKRGCPPDLGTVKECNQLVSDIEER